MSTVEASKPRRPSGSIGGTGGQYAQKTNSPPEGSLAESATGSFLYPPQRFDSLEDYLEFFDTQPISDQVLSNASAAYLAWRARMIDAHVTQRYDIFVNTKDNIAYKMAAKYGQEGLRDAVNAEKPKWIAEAEAAYPITSLPRPQARAILRAHQITFMRGMLRPEDEQAALDHAILHRGEPVRAVDLANHYNTDAWAREALTESDFAQADALNSVAELLRIQQGLAVG